jgi:hypothetical protein
MRAAKTAATFKLMTAILLTAAFFSAGPVHAARLHGKSLDGKTFKAELRLKKGSPVKGKILFKRGKNALFIAHDGTRVGVRLLAICASGVDDSVDGCWPDLRIELDDLSTRGGELHIY